MRTTQPWNSWDVTDFNAHLGKLVEVRRIGEETVLMEGVVCQYTDMYGGPAIQQYGEYGLDHTGTSVVRYLGAPPPPQWPSMPKRSEHQNCFRDPCMVPRSDHAAYLQASMQGRIQEWRDAFFAWLQQYQFRATHGENE